MRRVWLDAYKRLNVLVKLAWPVTTWPNLSTVSELSLVALEDMIDPRPARGKQNYTYLVQFEGKSTALGSEGSFGDCSLDCFIVTPPPR